MADQGWDTGEIAYLADIQHPFEYKSEAQVNKTETENLFYNFLSSYRDSDDTFYYRDLLRRQYNSGNYFVTVNLEHLSKVNEILANNIIENPTEYLPLFENAINRAVDEMTRPRPPTAPFKPLQLTISSDQNPIPIRELDAQHISKLVKVPGIVINVSSVKAKATIIFLACKNCGNTKRISLKSGFSGINFPRRCDREPIGGEEDRCPLDPYEIVGDKCTLVDQQVLKLQESPEMVPTGELPRHVLLSVDRFLTNTVMAGSRVTTVGIFDIYQNSTFKSKSDLTTRTPYIRVVGFMHDKEEDGRGHLNYSSEDETLFIALSKLPDIYERIARSISPTILGSVDIKKALACLLFGGSRKRLPDGLKLRGDINVLLLGDPGTAKSQLLKYVEKMAPVAVYTSGKGSSAAGLTASVIRDPASRDFHLEAGAMVLADGGVACIDEFDKMRESDRVAIHEAMEQQTISIAKAGITTILNSRTSVLAAANSTFGRWDDSPGPEQNIDFQATILSRFDCIFIVKDTYDEHSDSSIAMHVIRFHQKSTEVGSETSQTILDPELLKKYINYAKRTCGPRLSEEAKERLISEFVSFRQSTRNSRSAITVTVRQLEALVRISEAIAKMRLAKFASLGDVEEALRLFRVSTLDAAKNGDVTILEGMQGSGDKSLSREIEKRIQRRFFIGANVSERVIIEDFLQQGYPEAEIRKALWIMVKRGDLEYRYQRKVLHRFR